MTVFLRLLESPITAKGNELREQVALLNKARCNANIFLNNPTNFAAIPGTPFAYWVSSKVYGLYKSGIFFRDLGIKCYQGLITADDSRFLRLSWEIIGTRAFSAKDTESKKWALFVKGGEFSTFYSNVYMLVDCENRFEAIIASANEKYPYLNGKAGGFLHAEPDLFFQRGLTYTRRTSKDFSVRALSSGCVFSDKGPGIFIDATSNDLYALLAVLNSRSFGKLLALSLGAATLAARSYETGILEKTPVPKLTFDSQKKLSDLAREAFKLARKPATNDEITLVFQLPAIVSVSGISLATRLQRLYQNENQRKNALYDLQREIDERVAGLYNIPELSEFNSEQVEVGESKEFADQFLAESSDDEEEDLNAASTMVPRSVISDFLMWCVGVAFGRWDIRYALDSSKLPQLPDPFDPLPVCAPGMLINNQKLPLLSAPEGYPISVAWDGFLVDDPGHPRDIVFAVNNIFHLLWTENAESIEAEVCKILGAPDLRSWFRDPKGFFGYHIKRYSKSRRKAPIYWLLQSAKRNYGIWLYYPRLNPDSLFRAGREYADAKLSLEMGRLKDLQTGLSTAIGSARKVQERKMATQEALAAELKSFQKALDAAAMMELKPDLNDGVLLNIAPLYELVLWKEAERTWQELLRGKYEWSSISKWLRQKGLVKS